MGLKFTKENKIYDIPFRSNVKETHYLTFNCNPKKYIDLTDNIRRTRFPNIKFTKNGVVRYARTEYETYANNVQVIHPNYWNDGLRTPATSIYHEHYFVLEGYKNIIVAFLYDLCLEHEWNKKNSSSIYGGYIAGNPTNNNMTYFYTHQSWQVREAVMPSGEINISSVNDIKNTSHFYFETTLDSLDSNYKKVWTKQYKDSEGVRTTNLNYYLKVIGNTLYLKEEFEFATGKRDRSNLRIKRKYKYAISNYD